jgi:hypothetical protein
LQDGDVIELCQVSDIRAGGLPKVCLTSCVVVKYIEHHKRVTKQWKDIFYDCP